MEVSENQKRFLKVAAYSGKELEPVGILAGCRGISLPYELDDGLLTEEQMEAIRKASSVSDLPENRITRKLFEDN